ncbi:hypothetical protein [Hamadaea tsunoensis]|uniref:hypothetical protein n=1 Tax=Hamadaea tsunoensis TaxID=53368 RepID=UPI00041FA85E|nr:hypothetical protein [Hamadaea tsunoensis]
MRNSALVAYGYDLATLLHRSATADGTEQARRRLLTAAGHELPGNQDDPWYLVTQLSERCGLHILTYGRFGHWRSFLAAWTRSVRDPAAQVFPFEDQDGADRRLSGALRTLAAQPDHLEPRFLLLAEQH